MTGAAARSSRPLRRVAAAGLSLAAVLGVAWVLWQQGGPGQWQRLRTASASPWLLPLIGGLLASQLLRAARLHAEWRGRTRARYRDCLALFLLHNAAVVWLPLRSGEASYLLWLKRRWQVPVAEALASLLWLRLQDALVLALISLGAWLALVQGLAPEAALLVGGACAVAGALALAGLRRRAGPWLARRQVTPGGWTGGWIGRGLHLAGRAVRLLLEERGGARAWALCIANWLVKLATLAAALALVGGLAPAGALLGVVAGEWAAVLPLPAPAGLGGYEVAVWAGVRAAPGHLAAPAAQVLSAALWTHGLGLLVATASAAGVLAAAAWRRWQAASNPAWAGRDNLEHRKWT